MSLIVPVEDAGNIKCYLKLNERALNARTDVKKSGIGVSAHTSIQAAEIGRSDTVKQLLDKGANLSGFGR